MVKYILGLAQRIGRGRSPDKWKVYGWRPARLDFTGKVLRAGVHYEHATSEADAVAWLMRVVIKYGTLHAVVVRLDEGRDEDGYRHVVYTVGEGKPWY